MTAYEIRSPRQIPHPGKQNVPRGLRIEEETTYFTVDDDAGTITRHHRNRDDLVMRLPGRQQPGQLPVFAQLALMAITRDNVPLTYWLFVDDQGRCVRPASRDAAYTEHMQGLLWPMATLAAFEAVGIDVRHGTSPTLQKINKVYPGAHKHWWQRG